MIIYREKRYSILNKCVRFIKDLRTLDKIPFSFGEYCYFIQPCDKTGLWLNRARHERMMKELDKYYKLEDAGVCLWRMGMSFARSYKWKNKDNIRGKSDRAGRSIVSLDALKYSYDKINHIPKRYLFDSLGNGIFGVVFEYGKNKVEKISFNGFNDNEKKFYSYLINNPKESTVLPKVYGLDDDQVILERLETDTPKIKKYRKWIDRYVEGFRKGKTGNRSVNWELVREELSDKHEFWNWLTQIKTGLRNIFGHKDFVGDLHGGNIGERPGTGEIVYFDPVI